MPDNRYLITIGSPDAPELVHLPKVAEDVSAINAFFTSSNQKYKRVLAKNIPLAAKAATIRDNIASWFADSKREATDYVVIYIAGHATDRYGRLDDPCLLLSNSSPSNALTVIKIEELANWLLDGTNERPQNILLILDVCFAGRLSGKLLSKITSSINANLEGGAGFNIIATSGAEAEAYDGYFVSALFDVLHDEAWRPADKFFRLPALVEGINHWFTNNDIAQKVFYSVAGATSADKFISTEQKALRLTEISDFSYWNWKARGVDFLDHDEWLFSGREQALSELSLWLTDRSTTISMYFITGDPGSGKSAVLGILSLAAFPATRKQLLQGLARKDGDTKLPPLGSINACLNIRGMDSNTVAAYIAQQLDLPGPTTGKLITDLSKAKKTYTLLLDSLDESKNPTAILNDLILPLSSFSNIRLIIGSRRNYIPVNSQNSKVIDLDKTAYFSRLDIESYVDKRLSKSITNSNLQPKEKEKLAATLSGLVAQKAGNSFLYARTVSRALAEQIPSIEFRSELKMKLPRGIAEAFKKDLDRFEEPLRSQVIDLLIPLAYTKGKGIPFKNYWSTIASFIAGKSYSNSDIRSLLESAGYYIIRDVDNDEPVYRLFHQAFADYLKEYTKDEGVHKYFALALLSLRGTDDEGNLSWKYTTEPYTLKYFAAHAAEAGILDAQLINLDFVTHYPPEYLLSNLYSVKTEEAWQVVKAYRRASHWFYQPALFISQLTWRLYEYEATALLPALKKLSREMPWVPVWAHWTVEFSNYVVAADSDYIQCFTTFQHQEWGAVGIRVNSTTASIWQLADGKLLQSYSLPTNIPRRSAFESITAKFVQAEQHAPDDLLLIVGWNSFIAVFTSGMAEPISTLRLDCTITAMHTCRPGNKIMLCLATQNDDKANPFSIFIYELPSFKLIKKKVKAAKGRISSLKATNWENQWLLISAGDTYHNGYKHESAPVKLWTLPALELRRKWNEDGQFCTHVFPLVANRELYILAMLSNHIVIYGANGTTHEVHNDSTYSRFVLGCTIKDNRYEILVYSFNTLYLFTVDFSQPFPITDKIERKILLSESQWSVGLTINNRSIVVSKESQQLRVWDFQELVQLTAAKPSIHGQQHLGSTEKYKQVLVSAEHILLLTDAGNLLLLDTNGKLLKQLYINYNVKGISILQKPLATEIVVGYGTNTVIRINIATLEETGRFELDGVKDISGCGAFSYRQQQFVFLPVQYGTNRSNKFAVRIWNLDTREEVFIAEKNRLRKYFEIDGWTDKYINAATYIDTADGPWILLGGVRGEVRVIEVEHEEFYRVDLDDFTVGNDDIAAVDTFPGSEGMLAAVSTDAGDLAIRDLKEKVFIRDAVIKAHRGRVNQACFHSIHDTTVLITAGTDKQIHFWDLQLNKLYSIDADHAVLDLAFLNEDTMLVLCGTGITAIQLNWNKILSSIKPSV